MSAVGGLFGGGGFGGAVLGGGTLKSLASSVFFSSSFWSVSSLAFLLALELSLPLSFFPSCLVGSAGAAGATGAAGAAGEAAASSFSAGLDSVDIARRTRATEGDAACHCRTKGTTSDGLGAAATMPRENWRVCWRRARRNISTRCLKSRV